MTGYSDFSPLQDRAKKLVTTITDEPCTLLIKFCVNLYVCVSTTSRTLLNFKVVGQRSRSHVCARHCG